MSLMSQTVYQKTPEGEVIGENPFRLKIYGGESLKVFGEIRVKVVH